VRISLQGKARRRLGRMPAGGPWRAALLCGLPTASNSLALSPKILADAPLETGFGLQPRDRFFLLAGKGSINAVHVALARGSGNRANTSFSQMLVAVR